MTDPKIQRWIDLLAALLGHHLPVTFEELARHVPAYLADGSVEAGSPSPSLKRMFERDKKELLEQGVPIQSVGSDGDEEFRYLLRTRDFYLPYLGVVSARGIEHPPTVDKYGYRALETLAFEPDELAAIGDAAKHAMQLADPSLVDDMRSALRKLAFDLPLGTSDGSANEVLVPPASRADPHMLGVLSDALFRRKRITFQYHSMATDSAEERTIEPYGLFFLNGHWYFAGHDIAKGALRNFRVSRIAGAEVNGKAPSTSDYEIPATFTLREHARSRQAWEIGDGDSYEATVEFKGETGAAIAAAALGRPDAASPSLRRFEVRRTESFARWLLTFAGEARPVAPAALTTAYADIGRETRALYHGANAHG